MHYGIGLDTHTWFRCKNCKYLQDYVVNTCYYIHFDIDTQSNSDKRGVCAFHNSIRV